MFNRYFEAGEHNTEFLFANVVVKNINFALISLRCLFEQQNLDYNMYNDEHTYYFFHIQSLLTACGNISNVFYSAGFAGRAATDRSRILRDSFDITRTRFPLVFQKEVRNTNEHFDERFDAFHGEIGDYNILDRNTPRHMRDTVMGNPHLRTFDRESGVYYTLNRQLKPIDYNLHDLRAQLTEMRGRIINHPLFEAGWIDRMPGDILK